MSSIGTISTKSGLQKALSKVPGGENLDTLESGVGKRYVLNGHKRKPNKIKFSFYSN